MQVYLSKSKIDQLGNRLKKGDFTDDDLRLLDDFRISYGAAYDFIVNEIRKHTQLEPTGKPAKSTNAIIEKLQRESIRLTQIQDIAGCRIVVGGITDQDKTISSLRNIFPEVLLVDRRVDTSHGYRAVHLIVQMEGKSVEIQVRSKLQHLWAEYSEKLSDVFDPSIKYGGGGQSIRAALQNFSELVAVYEDSELKIKKIEESGIYDELQSKFDDLQKQQRHSKRKLGDLLAKSIQEIEKKE